MKEVIIKYTKSVTASKRIDEAAHEQWADFIKSRVKDGSYIAHYHRIEEEGTMDDLK